MSGAYFVFWWFFLQQEPSRRVDIIFCWTGLLDRVARQVRSLCCGGPQWWREQWAPPHSCDGRGGSPSINHRKKWENCNHGWCKWHCFTGITAKMTVSCGCRCVYYIPLIIRSEIEHMWERLWMFVSKWCIKMHETSWNSQDANLWHVSDPQFFLENGQWNFGCHGHWPDF